jgi:MFS superfamily sulfate permease-like transporter
METMQRALHTIEEGATEVINEVNAECNPVHCLPIEEIKTAGAAFNVKEWIHIPYFPAFHRPAWMLRYILGPYDEEWSTSAVADIQAGLTVLMTLIPQALSQAQLANMPPIYGLYTAIIPTASYAFFGSSMQLTVGPTALISLMTGSLLTKYGVDSEVDLDLAVDTCAQAAFCVGTIIMGLGVLNLGHLINFMSKPVMAGFTTGAAFTIGLTQIKNAVGFYLCSAYFWD